jgi:hypothetical protein
MTKVDFISTQYLKDVTAIENAVDDAIIAPFITITQDTFLQECLGSDFFQELQTQIAANTLTATNEALIRDFIQPVVAHFTFWNLIPHLQYHASNASVISRNTDGNTKAELDELKYFRNGVRDTAEYYLKRLNRELQINLILYPTYAAATSLQNPQRNRRSYFNGIYLKGKGADCYLGEDRPRKK